MSTLIKISFSTFLYTGLSAYADTANGLKIRRF